MTEVFQSVMIIIVKIADGSIPLLVHAARLQADFTGSIRS